MYTAFRRRALWLAAAAIAASALAAGLAYAAIPDSNGVIHGCFKGADATKAGGAALSVIDSENGGSCNARDTALTWNQRTNVVVRREVGIAPAGDNFFTKKVQCERGEQATGGGFAVPVDVIPEESEPTVNGEFPAVGDTPNGWKVTVNNPHPFADAVFFIWVICATA